jgi:hypothetical protein
MFALVGMVLGICAACLWPTDAEKLEVPGISIDPQALLDSTGLAAAGDNFTWQDHPNLNSGTATELRTGVASKGRAFVRWTQATIDSVVGTGTLVSARLDITINSSSGWGPQGGGVSIHRVTKDWTELGSTANCAIDTNTGNDQADCSGATAWVLNNPSVAPWKTAATDSLGVTNGQTGKISFNVTADVQAFLDDTSNFGWVIKPKNDAAAGDVRLRSREATSNQPVLVLTVQTGWPILEGGALPVLDTSMTVALPSGNLLYRTDLTLRFEDGVTDAAKTELLTRYQMTVVGVTPLGKFFVRIPDPGASVAALDSIVQSLIAEAVISVAATLNRTPLPPERDSRFPTDGFTQARADWLNASNGTWAMRAIRAPLAWGCEMGLYGGFVPRVGILEWKHDFTHPEFSKSSPVPWEPPDALLPYSPLAPALVDSLLQHGTSVAGVLAAEGDNGAGVAGLNWKTGLRLYAGLSSGNKQLPILYNFFVIAQQLVADQVRVLSLSVDSPVDSTATASVREAQIRFLAEDMKRELFNALPSLLVVVAAGNERFSGSDSVYITSNRAAVMRPAASAKGPGVP